METECRASSYLLKLEISVSFASRVSCNARFSVCNCSSFSCKSAALPLSLVNLRSAGSCVITQLVKDTQAGGKLSFYFMIW